MKYKNFKKPQPKDSRKTPSPGLQKNQQRFQKEEKKLALTLGLIVALLGFLIYFNSLGNEYIMDDFSAVKENIFVKQGTAGIPTILKTSYRYGFWSSSDDLYRPMSLVLFATEWQISPDSPHFYHFVNMLLYAITGFLLFLTLSRIFEKQNMILPFITSLLFMAHPIHTEIAGYIKSADEILSFLFAIASMFFLWDYLKTGKKLRMFIALLCYFISLLSKESSVTFMAVIPLTLFFFTDSSLKKRISITALFAIPVLIYLMIRISVLSGLTVDTNLLSIDNVLMATGNKIIRYATAFYVLGRYLWLLFIPHPLIYDYSMNAITLVKWDNAIVWLAFLVHIAMAVYALMRIKKKEIIPFGILYYFITISIVSNLLLIIGSHMAERFLYTPSLGFCLIVAYALIKLTKTSLEKKEQEAPDVSRIIKAAPLLFSLTGVILLLYSFKTITRTADWKDDYTLYSHDLELSPKSARIHFNVGLALVKEIAAEEKDSLKKDSLLTIAIHRLEESTRLYPEYSDAYNEMGVAYHRKSNFPKAIENYQIALKYNPDQSRAYNNLGVSFFQFGKYNEALEVYQKAIKLDPKFADAYRNLGSTYGTLKDYNKAIESFQKSLYYEPNNAEVCRMMGITYQFLGDKASAQIYFDKESKLKASGNGKME